jgi:TolB-like protein/DNA-binding winged helix-turn-helix (wHTH) protein
MRIAGCLSKVPMKLRNFSDILWEAGSEVTMGAQNTRVYRLGTVEIDLASKCIRRNGVDEYVRPKTLDVLAMLIEQRNRAVTKEELIGTVWKDTVVTDDVLVQSIGEIRKLLGDDARSPQFIKTLAKIGYRWVGPAEEFEPEPRLTQELPTRLTPRSRRSRWLRWKIAAVAGAMIVVSGSVIHYGFAVTPDRPSIAVLPFANLTGNADYEYLSDGLTDEITNSLISTGRLRVMARSSAFHFKEAHQDARSIGRQLNVDTILEGSVRKSGDGFRIIAELSRTSDGYGLWSKSYDASSKGLPAVADDLFADAAEALNLKIPANAEREPQVSSEARNLYLIGRFLWNQRSHEALLKSVKTFEQAIAKEPGYALAYAGLADSYTVLLDNYGYPDPRDLAARAEAAARKAIDLDGRLSDPHAALASALTGSDWDWKGAEVEFKLAIALNPESSTAHHWYGHYLAQIRHFDEALREIRTAIRYDPLSMMIRTNLGGTYFAMREYDRALEQYRGILELDPSWKLAHWMIGVTLLYQGKYEEGLVELKRGRGLRDEDPPPLDALLLTYALSGRTSEAREIVRQLERTPDWKTTPPFELASTYALVGERDRAFELLDRALDDRWGIRGIQNDTRWDHLRGDPRYKAVILKVGFPK